MNAGMGTEIKRHPSPFSSANAATSGGMQTASLTSLLQRMSWQSRYGRAQAAALPFPPTDPSPFNYAESSGPQNDKGKTYPVPLWRQGSPGSLPSKTEPERYYTQHPVPPCPRHPRPAPGGEKKENWAPPPLPPRPQLVLLTPATQIIGEEFDPDRDAPPPSSP